MTYQEMAFESGGVRCSGWHFPGTGDAFDSRFRTTRRGDGTRIRRNQGLRSAAVRRAASRRQAWTCWPSTTAASVPRKANRARRFRSSARSRTTTPPSPRPSALPGVDPNRIVLWGSSLSGGHVLRVAAGRADIAAVIAMTPMTNSLATGRLVISQYGAWTALRSTGNGLRSRVAGARGKSAVMMPVVSRPGEHGALTLEGSYESYLGMAGPTWRNEIDASIGLELSRISTRQVRQGVTESRCWCRSPTSTASFRLTPWPAPRCRAGASCTTIPAITSTSGRATTWFDRAAADQVTFLRRSLIPDRALAGR